MNKTKLCFVVILMLGAASIGLIGCSGTSDRSKSRPTRTSSEPTLSQLCKQMSLASEAGPIRQLLHQFTPHTTNKAGADEANDQAKQQRDWLQKELALSSEETEEIESLSFRPMDAHYLESCFLMRDAARHMEKATRDQDSGLNLPTLQLIRFAFSWVTRQVLPGAPFISTWQAPRTPDAWVPSAVVLRRGFGSPRDRALIFLEILRQMQMDGCLFDAAHPLVGVLHNDDIYLFDPVLGLPVAVDGKKTDIATLAMVQADGSLLKPHGIAADDFAKSEIVLNCPLSSLAPRMKVLEGLLRNNLPESDRIILFVDAARLAGKLSKTKAVVRLGNSQPNRLSPTRILYSFLPPAEGGRKPAGNDKEDVPGREKRFRELSDPVGLDQIKYNCEMLGFSIRDLVNPAAKEAMLDRAKEVMKLYTQQPREMLLRGQMSPLHKRLKRITDLLENLPSVSDPDFHDDLMQWYKAMRSYVGNLNAFWPQDQLFTALLDVESDLDLRAFEKKENEDKDKDKDNDKQSQPLKKIRPYMLTYVELAGCCRGLISPEVHFFIVQLVLEKAEAAQARCDSLRVRAGELSADKTADVRKAADARARADKAFVQAQDDWRNARLQLAIFNRKFPFGASQVKKNVQNLRSFRPADYVNLENLNRAWSMYCFTRLQLIGAMENGPDIDQQILRSEIKKLESDLRQLATDEDLRTNLRILEGNPAQNALVDQLRGPGLNPLIKMTALHKAWDK